MHNDDTLTIASSPLPLGVYRHYKGQCYQVIGVAHHSETEDLLVVYRALYGAFGLWVRPFAMFTESVTLPNGSTIARFSWDADLNQP